MAQQDIIVVYKAEIEEFTRQLKLIAGEQEAIVKGAEKAGTASTKSATTLEFAAKKRLELLALERKALEVLQRQQKLAFDPKVIAEYNKKIAESQNRISLLTKGVSKEGNAIGSIFRTIGSEIALGIGAAFSVAAVIQFGKASINAFLEAQENAEKLRFAITQIGGESEAAFNRLIEQSKDLQGVTIFSDDAIQQAQAALSTFGLTSDQIEEILPKLADFASATKKDLGSATTLIGQGLQGMGRELKKFGIQVTANQTPLENLATITDGLGKFAGSSAKEIETLTGQLKQQENVVDDLQEEIGSKLAGSFVNARVKALQFFSTMLDGLKGLQSLRLDFFQQNLKDRQEAIIAELEGSVAVLVQGGIAEDKARQQVTDRLRERLEKEIEQKSGVTEFFNEVTALKAELSALEAYNEQLAVTIERQKNTLTAEQLRGKSLNELNKLLEQNSKLNDATSQSNVQLIENELKEREKAAKKATEEAARELEKQKEDVRQWVNDVAGLLNDARLKRTIEVKLENVKQFESDLDSLNEKRIESDNTFQKFTEDNLKKRIEQQAQANELLLQNSAALASELSALFQNLGDKQIEEIERVRERRLEDIDEELETLTEQRESKLINEEDFEKRSAQLKQKRVDAEKKAADQINKIKKRQAVLDKLNATFKIILSTAEAIAEVSPNPFLIAFAAALGAAQLANVAAAQPPAFKKGTKNKKGSGLALVGEQGPEITYLPDQAKVLPAREVRTYGKVLDAMFDNNLDRYVHKTYVAPALIKQQQKHEAQKQQEFAQNISNSFAVQNIGGMDEYGMRRALSKPLTIRKESAEYMAKALADQLKPDFRTL